MSTSTATLLASLVGVFGVLVGLVFERLVLRSIGRLWCEPMGWKLRFMNEDGELSIERADDATYLNYSFDLDVFNGRDLPTGLRNLKVILVCNDGELVSKPEDRTTRQVETLAGGLPMAFHEEMSVINLPPRQWVRKEFKGSFRELEGVNVGEWQRADLVGEWPSLWRKTFKKPIAKR